MWMLVVQGAGRHCRFEIVEAGGVRMSRCDHVRRVVLIAGRNPSSTWVLAQICVRTGAGVDVHREAGWRYVFGYGYAAEHWLGTFALTWTWARLSADQRPSASRSSTTRSCPPWRSAGIAATTRHQPYGRSVSRRASVDSACSRYSMSSRRLEAQHPTEQPGTDTDAGCLLP
jgi:hypothetical protein